jgi:hypothetical protein
LEKLSPPAVELKTFHCDRDVVQRRTTLKRMALPGIIVLAVIAIIWFAKTPTAPDVAPAATVPDPKEAVNPARQAVASNNPLAGTAHKTQAVEMPSGDVKTYLPALLQQASGPNPSAEAALKAFHALNACRFRSEHPTPPKDEASDLTRPSAKDCAGITAKDWSEAPKLLKLAAELGNESAMLAYAQKAPLDGKELSDFVQRPEELVDFKNNAQRYLLAASEDGNIDAMWLMSEALRKGDLMNQDTAAAYQYKYALSRTGSAYSRNVQVELATIESQLKPAEVLAARESANKFLERCCARLGGGDSPLLEEPNAATSKFIHGAQQLHVSLRRVGGSFRRFQDFADSPANVSLDRRVQ